MNSPSPSPAPLTRKVAVNDGLHRADMRGPLFKRRGGYGKHMPNSWQSRYFFLIDGVLSYYDSEHIDNGVLLSPDARPRGALDLTNARCLFNQCAEGEPTEYTIVLFPENSREKWKLCAETLEDYKRWCEALKRFVGHLEEIDELASDTLGEDRRYSSQEAVSLIVPQPHAGGQSLSLKRTGGTAGVSGGVVKKRIRLKKKPGIVSSEAFETFFVVVILNVCLLLAVVSPMYEGLAYLLLANAAVLRTLSLRGGRCAESSGQLETAREGLKTLADLTARAQAEDSHRGEVVTTALDSAPGKPFAGTSELAGSMPLTKDLHLRSRLNL
jgi:hypothetical protein